MFWVYVGMMVVALLVTMFDPDQARPTRRPWPAVAEENAADRGRATVPKQSPKAKTAVDAEFTEGSHQQPALLGLLVALAIAVVGADQSGGRSTRTPPFCLAGHRRR